MSLFSLPAPVLHEKRSERAGGENQDQDAVGEFGDHRFLIPCCGPGAVPGKRRAARWGGAAGGSNGDLGARRPTADVLPVLSLNAARVTHEPRCVIVGREAERLDGEGLRLRFVQVGHG